MPAINMRMYLWDGETVTLNKHINIWWKAFGNLADKDIIPLVRTIIPWKFYQVISQCKTFKECLNELCTQVTCENVHTEKLEDKMMNVPHLRNTGGDRIVIETYIGLLLDLLEMDNTTDMSAQEVNNYFVKY